MNIGSTAGFPAQNMNAAMNQDVAPNSEPSTQPISADREQAMKNALANIQARYGEKPKESRVIKKSLDKDDFMKIMITEMKHQDPTKPMDAEKLSTQMAQLTSVEQLKNVGASVDKLVEKNNSSDRLAMSAMIGKTVTVDKSKFNHSKGYLSPVTYNLPEDASKVKISILDEAGEEVFSKELDPQKGGAQSYNWDGLANNGIYVKSGSYAVRVDAENAKGSKMKIDPISKETIQGVSFDGSETNFIVGTGKNNQKVAMRNVIRIEGSQAAPAASIGTANAAASAPAAAATEPFALPAELKNKLSEELGQGKSTEEEEPVINRGFPNGLQDKS